MWTFGGRGGGTSQWGLMVGSVFERILADLDREAAAAAATAAATQATATQAAVTQGTTTQAAAAAAATATQG